MRYLREDELIANAIWIDSHALELLLGLCKELPDQQWQTIDEFKANPVDGWCQISFGKKHNVDIAYYEYTKFWCNDMHDHNKDYIFEDYIITHVMPIKTPEAPK